MNLNIFERVFFLLSFGNGTKYLKIHVSRLGELERECRFDRNFWSKLSQLFQTTCIRTRLFDLRQCLCFVSLPLCPPGVQRLIFWKPQLYNENVTDIKQTRFRRTWIKSDNCGKEKKHIQRDIQINSKSEKCAHINVKIRSWSFPLK